MTSVMGSNSPSRVVRGRRKKEKNHHRVILGILATQLDMSVCASMTALEYLFFVLDLSVCLGGRVGNDCFFVYSTWVLV